MRATPALPNMQKSQTLGRIFVAVSLVVFGVQHFMYGGFVAGLVPAFMPGRLFWAYFVGVAFFALAFVAFGIQHFVYAHFGAGLGPPFFTGRPLRAYLTGVVLVAIGTAIILGKKARIAATLLGTILFVSFLLIHAPRIATQLHNPGPWTSGFEILALCGAALVLSSSWPKEEATSNALRADKNENAA